MPPSQGDKLGETEYTMKKLTNETYRAANENREWTITKDGIIKLVTNKPVPVLVSVKVQIPEPETTAETEVAEVAETVAETEAEKKIGIYHEDGTINMDVVNVIKDLNNRRNNLIDTIARNEYNIKDMTEKGFMEALNNYMMKGETTYNGKQYNYNSFMALVSRYNDYKITADNAREALTKVNEELEKYEF